MRHLKAIAKLRVATKARVASHEAAIAARTATPAVAPLYANYINTAPAFRAAYQSRPGRARRLALLTVFQQYPQAHLAVNCHYQANMLDTDLALLVKQGLLRKKRSGGRGTVLNRSSAKRQSYLELA